MAGGQSRRRRARVPAAAAEDPLGLDGDLFEHVAHRLHHGEAFVAYRLRGNPMVLHSLEDGLPLASLHLRVASGSGAQALIARRPDRCVSDFLGVVSEDNQEFELVMTNLTPHDVLMFDIGGAARTREEEFWERTNPSFWSGRHRNDNRLNRSNILWPLTPNACSENHLHFQDTGEHRQLVLRATARPGDGKQPRANRSGSVTEEPGGAGGGFPLFVYPKYGTKTAGKFARTAWSCPETVLVVGSPALLDADLREEHNIQTERPTSPPGGGPVDAADEAAASFGVPRARFLEVLGVPDDFLRILPEEFRREVLLAALSNADLSTLDEESDGPPVGSTSSTVAGTLPAPGSSFGTGARPAEVSAGKRLLGTVAHSLLIEKFDFDRRGAQATLSMGVRDDLRVRETEADEATPSSQSDDAGRLARKLDQLVATRSTELLEESQSHAVYATPECVVCMESSPPPDTVLYQCGHRCVHLRCVDRSRLRRCPLCRSRIVALLPCAGPAETADGVARSVTAAGASSG